MNTRIWRPRLLIAEGVLVAALVCSLVVSFFAEGNQVATVGDRIRVTLLYPFWVLWCFVAGWPFRTVPILAISVLVFTIGVTRRTLAVFIASIASLAVVWVSLVWVTWEIAFG